MGELWPPGAAHADHLELRFVATGRAPQMVGELQLMALADADLLEFRLLAKDGGRVGGKCLCLWLCRQFTGQADTNLELRFIWALLSCIWHSV